MHFYQRWPTSQERYIRVKYGQFGTVLYWKEQFYVISLNLVTILEVIVKVFTLTTFNLSMVSLLCYIDKKVAFMSLPGSGAMTILDEGIVEVFTRQHLI